MLVKTQSTVTDKVKNRLEQLDDFEEVVSRVFRYVSGDIYNLMIFCVLLGICEGDAGFISAGLREQNR